MKQIVALFCALSAFAAPVGAAGSRTPGALAADVAVTVVAARFAALDEAFAAQAKAWQRGCDDPVRLRDAFHAAYDAWARVEMFRSGPLSRGTRAERIDYWPDPRNAVEKSLRALIAGEGPITATKMAEASVATQGLPALERLLFDDAAERANLTERQCAVGAAIAENLKGIALELDGEWNRPQGGEGALVGSVAGDTVKGNARAAALLTDLATSLRVIEERKLPPIFADGTSAKSNPHAAKSWRSKRSVRDVVQNLESLKAAYAVLAPDAPAAASVVEKLDAALAALARSQDANRAIGVVSAVNNARYYSTDALPGELGVSLGFNSLDGD